MLIKALVCELCRKLTISVTSRRPDLCAPLSELLKHPATVSLFGQHLKVLCEVDRGEILEQKGSPRKFRYRFVEPMMQPFILMQGLQSGAIWRLRWTALTKWTAQRAAENSN